MATYKPEPIQKYVDKMRAAIAEYMAMPSEEFENVHTCVSRGDKKIGATRNVSLPPVISCGNCQNCIHHCYDIKANLRCPNVLSARARNAAMLSRDRERYFSEINDAIAGDAAFRWHQGGEMKDRDYFEHMVRSAERNANQRQWGYTHRRDIVNGYLDDNGKLPENLSIMYSYEGTEPAEDNPHGMPEFRCIDKGDTPPSNVMQCRGDCTWCLKNRRGCPYGESAWCYKH